MTALPFNRELGSSVSPKTGRHALYSDENSEIKFITFSLKTFLNDLFNKISV